VNDESREIIHSCRKEEHECDCDCECAAPATSAPAISQFKVPPSSELPSRVLQPPSLLSAKFRFFASTHGPRGGQLRCLKLRAGGNTLADSICSPFHHPFLLHDRCASRLTSHASTTSSRCSWPRHHHIGGGYWRASPFTSYIDHLLPTANQRLHTPTILKPFVV
jgi:hypothetical protein